MAHQNTRSEKQKFSGHNRKARVAKFKRNLHNRKRRRWDNKIHKTWVEERELREPSSSIRSDRNNIRERDEGEMPDTL